MPSCSPTRAPSSTDRRPIAIRDRSEAALGPELGANLHLCIQVPHGTIVALLARRGLRRRPTAGGRRVPLLRDLDGPALADHDHLDLARILELILDLARDLVREEDGAVVVDLRRLDDDPDLAAGL
jgi:hypothetical protein